MNEIRADEEHTISDKLMEVIQSIQRPIHGLSSQTKDWLVLAFILSLLTVSFIYGWYVDPSTPRSGLGWADQNLYTGAAALLGEGELPNPGHLHYQMGYPMLGALAYQVLPGDPFMPVSFLLLMASATFIYFGSRQIFSRPFALLLILALFAWDLHGRTFHYSSELFVIPWNNQVLFFAFAFFFWLYTTRSQHAPSLRLCIAIGTVAGLTIATREESILFIVPLAAGFLIFRRANAKHWIVVGGFVALLVLPHLTIKTMVLDSPLESGRGDSGTGYGQLLESYLSYDRLRVNSVEVVLDSSKSITDPNPNREALLQAAPWLWLSPLGLIAYFARRNDPSIKFYLLISIGLAVFYLSGANMSAGKLKFHTLRYITPSLIAFNILIIYFLREAVNWISTTASAARES